MQVKRQSNHQIENMLVINTRNNKYNEHRQTNIQTLCKLQHNRELKARVPVADVVYYTTE